MWKVILIAVSGALLGRLWNMRLRDLVYYDLGLGRSYSRIEDFPYTCRRLQHPSLESCEDMILDPVSRKLFAACSTSVGRMHWSPGGNKYNISGRGMTDHISVLNIDQPGEDGFYGLHQLSITGNYKSATGGEELDLHGLDIETTKDGSLRFRLINHRPFVDESGNYLDATKVGANSTVEILDLKIGSSSLEYVKTVHSGAIMTPNNLVATGGGGFVFTNDHHAYKVGRFRDLAFFYGSGSVGYCNPNGKCGIAYLKGRMSNGIVKGHDGLYYVAQAGRARITVLELGKDGRLTDVDEIVVGMAVDNLSIDQNGDIFGAAFPKPLKILKAVEDPVNVGCPSTIYRIRKTFDQGKVKYQVERVLEDIEATVLPCSTVAVHDAKTDSYFMGSVTSPFITVCERKQDSYKQQVM